MTYCKEKRNKQHKATTKRLKYENVIARRVRRKRINKTNIQNVIEDKAVKQRIMFTQTGTNNVFEMV